MTDHGKSDASKLKPCPFCGGKADACHTWEEPMADNDEVFAGAYCTGCGAQISSHVSDFELPTTVLENCILAWNRRTEAAP